MNKSNELARKYYDLQNQLNKVVEEMQSIGIDKVPPVLSQQHIDLGLHNTMIWQEVAQNVKGWEPLKATAM